MPHTEMLPRIFRDKIFAVPSQTDGSPQASERKAPNMVGGNVANLVKRISTELQSKSEVPVRAGETF